MEVGSDVGLCMPVVEDNGNSEEVEVSEDAALPSLSQAADNSCNSDTVCPFFVSNSCSHSHSDSDCFSILSSQTQCQSHCGGRPRHSCR